MCVHLPSFFTNAYVVTTYQNALVNLLGRFYEEISWLVGCFGFNGPLRQYFSLYLAVSLRGEKEERKDRG